MISCIHTDMSPAQSDVKENFSGYTSTLKQIPHSGRSFVKALVRCCFPLVALSAPLWCWFWSSWSLLRLSPTCTVTGHAFQPMALRYSSLYTVCGNGWRSIRRQNQITRRKSHTIIMTWAWINLLGTNLISITIHNWQLCPSLRH